ncbi:MAG: DUF4175 family protein [Proteobacteria bacterium]|nr:DUF4175 family protein [Pseudomonadota bacterium]
MKLQDALHQLARETERARRRLMFERGLRAGLALLLAIGAWAAIALAGAHALLPLMAQTLTALAALALFGWLGWRAKRAWRAPTETEARARLASDSRLDLGAFDALRDQPTQYDVFSMALWGRERERALERAGRAHAGPPRPKLDDLDPYKLRYAVLAALIGGFMIAGSNAGDRLTSAFIPDPGPLLGDGPMAIEAWVTPAEYTHGAPVSLSDRLGQTIVTPPSVEATVRLTGPAGAPRLVFEGVGGPRTALFTRAADGAWEAHLALHGAGQLKIVRFHTRASWRIAPTPDATPTASFTQPIEFLPNERASIGWRVADDFGVRRLLLRVRPVSPPPGLVHADPVDTELEAPAGDPREADGESQIDLAAHPYAGMEIEAQIVAVDALGQEGASQPMRVTLPEKVFLQPLARAAIEIRRHILTDRRAYRPPPAEPRRTIPAGDILLGNERIEIRDDSLTPPLERAPDGVRRAARLLDALMMEPQDGYFRDLAVYLGFRMARAELGAARTIGETEIAADILWRTALRAEYGGAADARRALEEAQRALNEALAQDAPQQRIQQLMQALRDATQRYMQALVQQAMRNGQRENADDTQDQAQISQRDIEEMMRQVQQLSEQGRNAEAQALLQRLNDILANLDVRLTQREQQGQGSQQDQGTRQQQMQQSMDQLSRTMGEQRALRDDTQQQQSQRQDQHASGGGGSQQGGQGGQHLADRQSRIQQGLSQAQRAASDAGSASNPDFDAAGRAMQQSEQALRAGDLRGAETAQDTVLDRLRRGASQLSQEMRDSDTRENGGSNAQASGSDRDPLGRASGDSGQGEGNGEGAFGMRLNGNLTGEMHARELFDEIRRRADDPNRPEAEREYLRRLLNTFDGT